MNYLNLFKVALKALINNKFRSFLSMLGIIIGVAAVIIMMAIGQGSKENIRSEIGKIGTNLISIHPGADMMHGGVRQDPSTMQTLKVEDYEAIKHEAKKIPYVTPEVNCSGQAILGARNTTCSMYGESTDFLKVKQWEIQAGTCFTEADVRKSAKVCVVGATIVKELFGETTQPAAVIGRNIRFKNIPLRIVGVLESKGYNSWGMDQDNVIMAPYTMVMKRLLAQNYLSSIVCSANSEEETEEAIEELTSILRRTHKLKETDEDNFTIRSQQQMMDTMSNTMDMVTMILVVAAGFSLLVAGIGIMNIMLVSVTERTREIGLRMAVGARGMDIMLQFLIESVTISLTGGVIGVLMGYGGVAAASALGLPAQVPLWSIMISFAVCVALGVIFGYVPARKAARMDPIEALRYE